MGRWHARAVERSGGRIAAVVDPDGERARALAERHGAVTAPSLEGLLADDRVLLEAVHVCTPSGTHEPLVETALAAGRHVLAEKPLAVSARATDRLLARADALGLLLCPVHQFPFQRGVEEAARRMVELGPLLHLDTTACSAGAEGRTPAERDRVAEEILPHPLSLVKKLVPGSLDDARWHAIRSGPGEVRIHGDVGSVTLSFLVSMGGRPPVNELRLVGREGTIHCDLYHGYAVAEGGGGSRARKVVRPFLLAARSLAAASRNLAGRGWRREPAYPGLTRLVGAFHTAVAQRGAAPIPPDEVREVARAREAILERLEERGERSSGAGP